MWRAPGRRFGRAGSTATPEASRRARPEASRRARSVATEAQAQEASRRSHFGIGLAYGAAIFEIGFAHGAALLKLDSPVVRAFRFLGSALVHRFWAMIGPAKPLARRFVLNPRCFQSGTHPEKKWHAPRKKVARTSKKSGTHPIRYFLKVARTSLSSFFGRYSRHKRIILAVRSPSRASVRKWWTRGSARLGWIPRWKHRDAGASRGAAWDPGGAR